MVKPWVEKVREEIIGLGRGEGVCQVPSSEGNAVSGIGVGGPGPNHF